MDNAKGLSRAMSSSRRVGHQIIRNTLHLHTLHAPHVRSRPPMMLLGALRSSRHPVCRAAHARPPRPLPVTRLATETALDRSTMGRNLDPLERRGLVRIEVGQADQRERVAHLTATGEDAVETALPYWRRAQERVAAVVDPSAVRVLAEQLGALQDA